MSHLLQIDRFGAQRKPEGNGSPTLSSTGSSNSLTANCSSSPSAPRRTAQSPLFLSGPSPPTRRPDRPGMNAFTVPSNEPPPAYTAEPTAASGPTLDHSAPSPVYGLESPRAATPPPAAAQPVPSTSAAGAEDPYAFFTTFHTTLLIDDSGSMAGRGWREVSQALATIAPIVTEHDQNGIDIYFLNHISGNNGSPSEDVTPNGYRGIKTAQSVCQSPVSSSLENRH